MVQLVRNSRPRQFFFCKCNRKRVPHWHDNYPAGEPHLHNSLDVPATNHENLKVKVILSVFNRQSERQCYARANLIFLFYRSHDQYNRRIPPRLSYLNLSSHLATLFNNKHCLTFTLGDGNE